ncbi:MAG: tRNA pseudouridine synthase A [Flavobacteriales bacterium]
MKHKHNYLIRLQYLGFRYRGWFWQRKVKTVQEMVQKTLMFVFHHERFKTLGAGRTDAMVSSNDYAFELFMSEPIEDLEDFMIQFNHNLPSDIRALEIKEVSSEFNVMNDSKLKEYVYLFSYGEKFHPFSAPFMAYQDAELDVELMKEGAKLFEGEHDFRKYCSQPSPNAVFVRTVDFCEIKDNDLYTANFFPKDSYMMTIRSKGFMRYQIRFIMGALFKLGRHEIGLDDIKKSLISSDCREHLEHPAPASGLILNKLTYSEFETQKEVD